jgi:type IV pilus assembly protein PilF
VLYEDIGEAATSRQHYLRAYELAPNNPVVLNNFAKGLCEDGSYPEADALFMQAAAEPFYQSPEVAWVGAAICAQRIPDVAKAEQYYRSALERNPRYPLALYRLAELLYDQEKYLPARALMQRFAESSAQAAPTLWLAAHIECKLSDRNALASLQLALIKRFPDSAQTRLLMEHKDYDLCKTNYRF